MRHADVPTAEFRVFDHPDPARTFIESRNYPVVVKADGLAAGKGVVICDTRLQAEAAAAQMFSGALLGTQETEVVLEEFLVGEELSFFALCDGRHATAIAAAQDHKRVGEGDTGPNTGGMGAYSTDGLLTPAMRQWLTKNVAQRVVDGMRSEGDEFKGILFCGIMMTARGPMVLEFNTRFGDPETQAILMRMETDILDLLNASIDGNASLLTVKMRPGASVCVIAASGGYPGKYATGKPIHGISEPPPEDVVVFHSGTAIKDGQFVTAGGRVLSITAVAPDLRTALDKAYAEIENISFEGMQYRRDIGHRAL
jgi:phosphoribosylamine--glycine ligase